MIRIIWNWGCVLGFKTKYLSYIILLFPSFTSLATEDSLSSNIDTYEIIKGGDVDICTKILTIFNSPENSQYNINGHNLDFVIPQYLRKKLKITFPSWEYIEKSELYKYFGGQDLDNKLHDIKNDYYSLFDIDNSTNYGSGMEYVFKPCSISTKLSPKFLLPFNNIKNCRIIYRDADINYDDHKWLQNIKRHGDRANGRRAFITGLNPSKTPELIELSVPVTSLREEPHKEGLAEFSTRSICTLINKRYHKKSHDNNL